MGNPKNFENPDNDQKFIIIISIGKPKGNLYREIDQFRRKSLDEITDNSDEKLALHSLHLPLQIPSHGISLTMKMVAMTYTE